MLTLDSFSQITQSIENEPWPQRKNRKYLFTLANVLCYTNNLSCLFSVFLRPGNAKKSGQKWSSIAIANHTCLWMGSSCAVIELVLCHDKLCVKSAKVSKGAKVFFLAKMIRRKKIWVSHSRNHKNHLTHLLHVPDNQDHHERPKTNQTSTP